MTSWIARLLQHADLLADDARFTAVALSLTTVSIALLHCAEAWGRARARRRTARAIAQTERSGPPEAQTWEHSHSSQENKLHKESH
jgi:hypothetical protein